MATSIADNITIDAVLELLNSVDKSGSVTRLNKPRGSEAFLFHANGGTDWRSDGYRWRQTGTSFMPKKNPIIRKVHFDIMTSSGTNKHFRKFVYSDVSESEPQYVVVHYLGESSVAENFPHGNSKQAKNFISSAPSLRTKLRDRSATTSFKDLLVQSVDESVQFQPRNSSQVKYYKSITTPERRLGSDMMVTLHEMAYAIPDFIWSIRTFPDLIVCFGIPAILSLVRNCPSIFLSYDTTFNLGDFYLSVLALKLSAFVETPTIPIAFVLHDRKFQTVHSEFCQQLGNRLKATSNVVLVTDGEAAIVSAVKESFPRWLLVNCSNHILTDVEVWLKRHHGKGSDVAVYRSNIRELLQCQSVAELATKLSTLEPTWSEAFKTYYNSYLVNRVETAYAGYLKSVGLHADNITTNMSESLNFVIKQFQGWKGNTADMCLLSLYQLQLYYRTLISRSIDGFGPFILQADYDAVSLNEVVKSSLSMPADLQSALATVRAAANGESTQLIPASIQALSATLCVVHVPDLQVFNVSDADCQTHAVALFPRETCTCPASTTCCHIIAAKRSIGAETTVRKPLILSTLRKNSRKANDKCSGKKRPRIGDLSYAAAPDSTATTNEDYALLSHVDVVEDHEYASTTVHGSSVLHHGHGSDVHHQRSTVTASSGINVPEGSPTPSTISTLTAVGDDLYTEELNKADGSRNQTYPDVSADMSILCDATQCINDNIINAAQQLLRHQYTNVDGLYDTVAVAACDIQHPPDNNCDTVQIVFDAVKSHWYTVTNKHCATGHLSIYCSLQLTPSMQSLATVAKLFRFQSTSLTIDIMNVAKQRGSVDCGLFAIANAELLAHDRDPCNVTFDQPQMRHHLKRCLDMQRMHPFPVTLYRSTRRRVVRAITVPLYCICRSPHVTGNNMVRCDQCREWYHQVCVGIGNETFEHIAQPSVRYTCHRCSDTEIMDCDEQPHTGPLPADVHMTQPLNNECIHQQQSDGDVFMTFVDNARKASLWLKKNSLQLRASVIEPWVVTATNEDIAQFLTEKSGDNNLIYEDVRDHLLFNFKDADDIQLFLQQMTANSLLVNVCLHGEEYISNNVQLP